MEIIRTYHKILSETTDLALATCVENKPNVRVLSFIFDREKPGVLYFATESISPKVAEALLNEHVAFTTVPKAGQAHVRSNETVMKKSPFGLDRFKDDFIARVPACAGIFAAMGDQLDVYELHIKNAVLVTGFEKPLKIAFTQIDYEF